MYKMLFKPTYKQHFVLWPCRSVSLRTCSLTTSTAPVRWPGGWGASVRPSDPWRHWTLLGWSGSGPTRPCAFSRTGRAAWFLFCSLSLYPYVWHFYFCPDLRLHFLSLFCLSLTKSNNSCSLCNVECLYLCLAVRRSMIKISCFFLRDNANEIPEALHGDNHYHSVRRSYIFWWSWLIFSTPLWHQR